MRHMARLTAISILMFAAALASFPAAAQDNPFGFWIQVPPARWTIKTERKNSDQWYFLSAWDRLDPTNFRMDVVNKSRTKHADVTTWVKLGMAESYKKWHTADGSTFERESCEDGPPGTLGSGERVQIQRCIVRRDDRSVPDSKLSAGRWGDRRLNVTVAYWDWGNYYYAVYIYNYERMADQTEGAATVLASIHRQK